MVFSESRVRLLRQRMGWTVSELARWLGCSSVQVSNWEKGLEVPGTEVSHQMLRLEGLLERHIEGLRKQPMADQLLQDREWDQVTREFVDEWIQWP